ncbi:class I SAM-dependent methyltransferase [Phenylobacterium sp.]|uniref:class I SAM-dependent methyltransferase n=1 Tax=Phenylobacterium sp. TaxID=1871053 RepID=UPI002DF6450C|nr:class I SAM-dependent methyltransferase [Phenylobacterium sp.]
MAAWSGGYFTDVQYTNHFYPQLAPGFMAFACLRQGVRPPALGPGARYLELGCGQGYGLNLLAAANPGMAFWGVDFHPGQIANAERLADAAGLSNVTFADLSFAQLLALPDDRLPRFEVIALHGIYSWVDDARRAEIVQILDRLLKPGGLVYVSYNCLPAWAPLIPLQRFVAEHVSRGTGEAETRVVAALQAALQMIEDKAHYFANAPSVKPAIERALRQPAAYLVHEYLHEGSKPQFHADVARELAGARLAFAATANAVDDIVHLAAPRTLQTAIRETSDRIWRETLLDHASHKPFRRDIFVRGRNVLPRQEMSDRLNQVRFALLMPAKDVSLEFPIPAGRLTGDPGVYGPILDALAEAPRCYGELAQLPSVSKAPPTVLYQAIALLVGSRKIHPVSEAADGGETARAFNRAVLSRHAHEPTPGHLAAPLIGSGVEVNAAEALVLWDVAEGKSDAAVIAGLGAEEMAKTGAPRPKDGKAPAEPAGIEAERQARIAGFIEAKLPLYRRLGVV